MADAKTICILYMEDDPGAARLLQRHLERLGGYHVDIAPDGEAGLAMYQQNTYDALAIDQSMPGLDGLDVLRIIAEENGNMPPVVMVTGVGSERLAVEAMKLGASDYIVKDINGGYLQLLPAVLEQAIHRYQLVEEKRQAEEEREKLIQELDAFAHTVAHDLKTPLTVLLFYSSFLKEADTDLPTEELREYLGIIDKTSNQMKNIIEELLLLSQVRKVNEIALAPLDMGRIVLQAHERLTLMLREYGGDIIFPEAWPPGIGYAPWIEEIWVNYLSNALKYGGTPPRIEVGGEAQPDGMSRFWVRDNGYGLTPEEQAELFTPFTRLSQVRVQGHGLGLSIVQRIVEKLGGDVCVRSAPGQGSEFSFTLPSAFDGD